MDYYNLLVVGNGFDLASGLPTSYSDFLNTIKFILNAKNNKELLNFNNFACDEKRYLQFANYVRTLNESNYFLKYFLSFQVEFKRWCDVETELSKILQSFDLLLSNGEIILHSNSIRSDVSNDIKTLNILNEKFVPTWNGLKISYDNLYRHAFIEDTTVQATNDVFTLKENFENLKTKIINGLYEDLKKFANAFKMYLNLIPIEKSLKCNLSNIGRVISFNYTHSVDYSFDPPYIYRIHGELNNEIVLGIDSSVKFSDQRFNKFLKIVQRQGVNEELNLMGMLQKVEIVLYFGLSFDSNDKDTFDYIFKNTDADHIIYYYGDLEETVLNIQKIIGTDRLNDLSAKGKIKFFKSSRIIFS